MMITEKSVFYPDPGPQPKQTKRSASPFLRFEKGKLKMIVGNKMPRIRIRDPFYAHIIEASSPSEIWIQMVNHIASQLEIAKNVQLEPVQEISTGDYVMARVSEDSYGRCRVMRTDYKTKERLVRFIDHGGQYWFPMNDLFQMPKKLWDFPWQTIPVLLFNVRPIDGKCWSKDEVIHFTETYKQFELFWIVPAKTLLQYVNDDSYYCRVNIYGIQNPVKEQLRIEGECNGIDFRNVFLASRGTFDDTALALAEYQDEYDAVAVNL
uniref:Tudor domain-containing protein n=1 Tax=Panagrellus redivivus TaxID=6233 RepID=A0A7E4VXE4_PANRE